MNVNVQGFFDAADSWKAEMLLFRELLLSTGLKEEFKWKHPCYTDNGKNIVIIGPFKEYCALMLFKGGVLDDPTGFLVQATGNSEATRQVRVTSINEIKENYDLIKSFIFQAIKVERSGKKAKVKTVDELDFPEELETKFKENKSLKSAFEALTPGRQKAYILHFSGAKQTATRVSRIERYEDRILNGKGMDDCICGLSKRMPRCDGSHKVLQVKGESGD